MRSFACWIFALALAAASCSPRVPTPSTTAAALAPPPARIPEGCAADQSGVYLHEGNAEFRYRARDDGGTLVLTVERPPAQEPSDAGLAASAAPDVLLERTAQGFVGQTRGRAFLRSGQSCAVSFPTEVLACEDGGLVLRAASRVMVDESCKPAPKGPSTAMREHRLTREPAATGAADGGR